MRKLLLFVATLLLYMGTASAQTTNIPLKQDEPESVGGSRSLIQIPTASIDGQVLIISMADETDFIVSVTDASGRAVYVGAYTDGEATITLPQLPTGRYCLRIKDEPYVYSGEFEITD